MPDDTADSLNGGAARLSHHAYEFARFLAEASDFGPGQPVDSKMELNAGWVANRIAHELRALDNAGLASLSAEDAIRIASLRSQFFDLIHRWGWDQVIGETEEQFLADRRREWEGCRLAFLSVVRLLFEERIRTGRDDLLPDRYLDDAETAKREGIQAASMSPDDAKTELDRLYHNLHHVPCLAKEFPTCTPDEFRDFEQTVFYLGKGPYGIPLYASKSDRPTGPIDPSTDPSTTPGSPPGTREEAKGTTEQLTPNDWKLLRSLLNLGAIDPTQKTTRSQVTLRAKTGDKDSKHNQKSFDRLKQMGLIDAVKGSGTWLTEAGVSLATPNKR